MFSSQVVPSHPCGSIVRSVSPSAITLRWERFTSLTAARLRYGTRRCVYVQADRMSRAVRVGKASLWSSSRTRTRNPTQFPITFRSTSSCRVMSNSSIMKFVRRISGGWSANLLDQVLLFTYFELRCGPGRGGNLGSYVVLQIHGGCDVRGGYSRPRVFTLNDSDELAIFDYRRG